MTFDVGTLIDQFDNIASSFPNGSFFDGLLNLNAEILGAVAQSQENMTTTAATSKVTPTTAADGDMVGKLIVVESGADAGTYLIDSIATGDYVVVDSNGAALSFTGAAAQSTTIYDFPSLESDLNYLRTKSRDFLGLSDWFADQPTYPDQDALGSSVDVSFEQLKDAHNKIQNRAISVVTSAIAVTIGDVDEIIADTTPYTSASRNTGVPTSDGAGTPDGTNFKLSLVEILDPTTREPLATVAGDLIWGRLIDGANAAGGTGAGTDVGVKFFTGPNTGAASAYTWLATDPATVLFVYNKVDVVFDAARDDMLGLRVGRFNAIDGDSEQADDIRDLQEFVGSGDNITTPVLTNTTDFFPFSANNFNGPTNPADTDVEELLNVLNDEIGFLDFSALSAAAQAVLGGDGSDSTITDLLGKLAIGIADVSGVEKVHIKATSTTIKGNPFTVPGTKTYTPKVGTFDAGENMDVYLNGVLMQPHRTDYDNDYEETSTTTITFKNKNITSNDRVSFIIRN